MAHSPAVIRAARLFPSTLTSALALVVGCACVAPAMANDGFGGLTATGLSFGNTDAVSMASEDLFIGLDKIKVDYVFKNLTDQDVTGEMIFPLPPISVGAMLEGMINLPEAPFPDNLVGFTAVVDGRPVAVSIDRVAVITPEWQEDTPASIHYDTPGRDVTELLASHGVPLTLAIDDVVAALAQLPVEVQAALEADGIAEFYDAATEGAPRESYPQWSLVYRYHWTQTFPAAAELRVSHEYDNRPPGGLFYWEHPVKDDYMKDYAARHCIDEGTSKAMAKAIRNTDAASGEVTHLGVAYFTTYVLRTANSWAGPIGTFRLTLDKGAAENVISLCATGIKKTGPTTFVMERKDYTPERDLEIMVLQSMRVE